jgi:hypothetical protein
MPITSLFPRSQGTRPGQPDWGADSIEAVRALNHEYLAAVQANDAGWFDRHLAEDAVIVLGSGRRLRKSEFLASLNDVPPGFRSLEVRNLTARWFGATVQVDADSRWELADGSRGVSRYIDTYVWLDGRWQVVSAQITPLPASTAER